MSMTRPPCASPPACSTPCWPTPPTRVQPPTDKGRRLKIYYMTQVGIKPPHFVVFCNDKKLFHFSYQRYLENQIRSVFGLEGTPITITIRQKGEDDG